jgi:multiple sugar transport system permease protein
MTARLSPSSRAAKQALTYLILGLAAILILLPEVWLLVTSLKKNTEYLSPQFTLLPAVPQWDNYVQVFTMIPFLNYVRNSLVLGVTFTVLCVMSSSLAGYAFARIHAPGRNMFFSIVIALLMIPAIVTVIPQFVIFSRIGLTGNYWPWILWGISGSSFHIFLFRQFFAAFPRELEEAAELDGCGPFRIFLEIFLPNAQPVLATSAILNFMWVWGDWFNPIIFLSDANTTLAAKLGYAYVTPQGHQLTPIVLAACVLYVMVPVVMFFIGQKYILQGVVTSGLKG